MKLAFLKIHGAGNDYILVDCLERDVQLKSEVIQRISQRHFGIGSDGVILVKHSGVADARMEMYNSDGSRGAMCGNGIRCVAKLLLDCGHSKNDFLMIDSDSGIKGVEILANKGDTLTARVKMGKPELCGEYTVKQNAACKAAKSPSGFDSTLVSMGNPHAVVFCKNVDTIDLDRLAGGFTQNPAFQDGVNVEIAEITGLNSLKVRVFERGAGETLACGTGACAAVAAAISKSYFEKDAEVAVNMHGGTLKVCWPKRGPISLCGPAVVAYRGEVEI